MTLENLEQRVVLSDVSAVYSAGVLTIVSNIDSTKPGPPAIFGNAFNITEASAASGGAVTVSPASLNTTINGFTSQIFVTPGPVSTINVTITSASPSNTETVNLTGPGKTVPTTVQDVNFTVSTANLTLHATNLDNSGPLNIIETGQAGLTTNIDNSHFSSLTITQDPQCCVGVVEIGNTTVDGNVLVRLGNAAASSITIQNGSHLGSTVLAQGSGAGDNVQILNSYVQDVNVTQGGGAGDVINIDTVKISPIGKGVITSQGNGKADKTTINAVTLDLSGPASNNTSLNPFAALPSIRVSQGTGDTDVASVTNSSVTGDITITQTGGAVTTLDQATISNSTAGVIADLTSIGLGKVLLNGNLNITQGNGFKDQATITGSTGNNANILQGNGAQDSARVTSSTINGSVTVTQGTATVAPPVTAPAVIQTGGLVALVDKVTGTIVDPVKNVPSLTGGISITQTGSAAQTLGNTATISNSNAAGSVSIGQANGNGNTASILNVDPTTVSITQGGGNSQTATIDTVTATNSVFITQGGGNSDTATINKAVVSGAASNGVTINQGGGNGDVATISNSSATSPGSPTTNNANNNVVINQGGGTKDSATITGSRADGNFSITQGDGSLDTATISNSTAGFVIPIAPGLVFDWQGTATIIQGNGNGDVANFTGLTVNNISATQGDNIFDPTNCTPGTYDEVHVNSSTVTSDITIFQGDGAALGNYWATIGDLGAVSAGGNTVIQQNGTGNVVQLGGGPVAASGFSFVTNFLDVFTGTGGAFVVATATDVVQGAQGLFGPFTITAAGPGNTYINGGGNSGVTVDPNFNM